MIPQWVATAIEVVLALVAVALLFVYDFRTVGGAAGIVLLVLALSIGLSVKDERQP